ncbi:MAG: alpha/beta hydrolase [Iamia sp.]
MRRSKLRLVALVVAVAGLGALAACTPTSGRYITMIYSEAQITRTANISYGSAPALPDRGNGQTSPTEVLKLDVVAPSVTADAGQDRPAVLLVHGGGFRGGTKAKMTDVAFEWARRGYVAVPVGYRLDDDNQCQAVQHGQTDDPALILECETAVRAAQHDVQAAVRWVRAHRSDLGIDPAKVAVWGTSAGAVTAINVAYNSTDPGTSGTPGQSSEVSAVAAMSGAAYDTTIIDGDDGSVFQAHNPYDNAVLYSLARDGADAALARGLTVEFVTYTDRGTAAHGMGLYKAHKAELDERVAAFFYEQLDLSQT